MAVITPLMRLHDVGVTIAVTAGGVVLGTTIILIPMQPLTSLTYKVYVPGANPLKVLNA